VFIQYQGYKYAISLLNEGRVGIGAQQCGLAAGLDRLKVKGKNCFDDIDNRCVGESCETSQEEGRYRQCSHKRSGMTYRKISTTPILTRYKAILFEVAQVFTELEAARGLVFNAARLKELGFQYRSLLHHYSNVHSFTKESGGVPKPASSTEFIKKAAFAKLYASQVAEKAASGAVSWCSRESIDRDNLGKLMHLSYSINVL